MQKQTSHKRVQNLNSLQGYPRGQLDATCWQNSFYHQPIHIFQFQVSHQSIYISATAKKILHEKTQL